MDEKATPVATEPTDEFATTATMLPATPDGDVRRQVTATSALSEQASSLDATLSAIASARAGSINAGGSAIGIATVAGSADLATSAIGLITAKGDCNVRQSYVQGLITAEKADLDQTVVAGVLAKTITFDRSASVVTISNDAEVRSGMVGVLLAGRANVSEDARVLLTGRALAVLALALIGGLGLVAVAVAWSAQRLAAALPRRDRQRWGLGR